MKIKIIASVLLCCLTLNSCSYIEAENKIKQKMKGDPSADIQNEESYMKMEDSIREEKIQDSIKNKVPMNATEEQLHYLGETFELNIYENKNEVTINNVELFDSLGAAGTSLSETIIFDTKSELYDLKSDSFSEGYKLFVADITVTNKSEEGVFDLKYICDFLLEDFAYSNNDNWVIWFSDHPKPEDDPDGKGYYTYTLYSGETKNVKVGWLIDMDKYSIDDLFIQAGNTMEYEKIEYVYLSQGE